MKEQLISFETAKLAKEKGFGGKGLTTSNGYFRSENLCNIPCNNKSDFCAQDECSAPTQSLLQKWLRDTYKLEILVIRPYNFSGEVYWSYDGYNNGVINLLNPDYNEYKSYEEALEKGLFEALKLI